MFFCILIDDKIRLQLFLDITDFGKQLEEKCNGYKGDSNYESLYKVKQIQTYTV